MLNKTNRKLILSSVLSVILCMVALFSTTFAWFASFTSSTYSFTNMGTVVIDTVVYDLKNSYDSSIPVISSSDNFKKKGQNLKQDISPVITSENCEPGYSNAKMFKITNNGTLISNAFINFTVQGELSSAISVSAVAIKNEKGNKEIIFETDSDINITKLDSLFKDYGGANVNSDGSVKLLPKESVELFITYRMDENAGNNYQSKGLEVDISVFSQQALDQGEN